MYTYLLKFNIEQIFIKKKKVKRMDLLRVPCHISVTNMQVLIIIKLNIECLFYLNISLNESIYY